MEDIDETLKYIKIYEDFINIKLQISSKSYKRTKFFDWELINIIISNRFSLGVDLLTRVLCKYSTLDFISIKIEKL